MTEETARLYKTASSGMCKKALSINLDGLRHIRDMGVDTFKNLSPGTKASIVGALAGGGAGLASDLMTPVDKDEKRTRRMLGNILAGATLGGMAGYGGRKLYERMMSFMPGVTVTEDGNVVPEVKRESWFERNIDPEYSTALFGSGAATGTIGLNRLKNMAWARLGGKITEPLVNIGEFVPKPVGDKTKITPELENAYTAYSESIAHPVQRAKAFIGKLLDRKVFRTAIQNQEALDLELLNALETAKGAGGRPLGGPVPADQLRIVRSFWRNPRKVINAARNSKKSGRLIGAAALMALAGGIIRGAGARSGNK